jgi:hypothetical protein
MSSSLYTSKPAARIKANSFYLSELPNDIRFFPAATYFPISSFSEYNPPILSAPAIAA